jgi:hypothetical protein
MASPIIQRRVVKSISEFSAFKIALISYLIIFILTVIVMAVVALITWAGLAASGINLNNLMSGSSIGQLLSGFGINIPNLSAVIGTGSIVGIVLFIVFGLLFSIVFAAIVTFWTWIFNVMLKISGGIEVRYVDRTIRAEMAIQDNAAQAQNSTEPLH